MSIFLSVAVLSHVYPMRNFNIVVFLNHNKVTQVVGCTTKLVILCTTSKHTCEWQWYRYNICRQVQILSHHLKHQSGKQTSHLHGQITEILLGRDNLYSLKVCVMVEKAQKRLKNKKALTTNNTSTHMLDQNKAANLSGKILFAFPN